VEFKTALKNMWFNIKPGPVAPGLKRGGDNMKTRIETTDNGNVKITYTDYWTDEDRTRTFFCPDEGGYVREWLKHGNNTQVCDQLAHRGPTLRCTNRADLPEMIRREYKAMRRAEKREEKRMRAI
jgi:hypothetical protein